MAVQVDGEPSIELKFPQALPVEHQVPQFRVFTVTPATHYSTQTLVEHFSRVIEAYALMRHRIERCAKDGALRVPVEQAAEQVWAVIQGLVLSIVASPTGAPPSRQSTRAALGALVGNSAPARRKS